MKFKKLPVQLSGCRKFFLLQVSYFAPVNLELVQRACNILQNGCADRQSIPELCQKLGVGYEKFRKLFKEIAGVSPVEYRIQSRMNTAKARLIETNDSITQIASELGFSDTFTFSRQFKKSVGVSPTEFKKKY